ncbi:Hsp33 family molecular chaperone HslO [Reinekea blandensis]|uniref:Chaperonin, 33 kDa n=1 Tax=Reinekea blandensis MED297 TaxID=314283 RepID=A4BAF6_9GAMM|nr:Hsp33 family molecular chaperone HslO [Reinekea blandensis]EAR10912.1 chaperonin, 33 kDa [Reinekea sp. MED297] [Reinekea blandensis MED297]
MSSSDQTLRFLFDQTPIRGELTQLDRAYQDVLSKHPYPTAVKQLLGEFMAATAMLSDTIKFDGTLSLQVRGAGQVRTLMAECRHNRALRAIAQYNDDYDDAGPVLGEGQMAITIEPDKGKRYQGIVSINDGELTLNRVLEDYFQQSEQIRTRIWLYADGQKSAGLLLQAMPESASASSLSADLSEDWERLVHLAQTLTTEEALSLPGTEVLHRLFHEETVRVYEPNQLEFECTCSRQRSEDAIRTMGVDEAVSLAAENGHIEIDCQFCHERYAFTPEDVRALFSASDDSTLN